MKHESGCKLSRLQSQGVLQIIENELHDVKQNVGSLPRVYFRLQIVSYSSLVGE